MAIYSREDYIADGVEPPKEEVKPQVAAPGVGTRALGLLQKGWAGNIELVADLTRRAVQASQLGRWSEADEAAFQAGRKEAARPFHEMEAAKAVEAHPATSVPGQLLSGAVEFLPQLGTYAAAEMVGGPLLAGAARASRVKPLMKAADFLSGTSGGKGLVTDTLRTMGRAGLTGTGVGALAADEGEVLSRAAEEGLGFAGAAGAFHLAGKGIVAGAKKLKGAIVSKQPQVGELRGMKSRSEAQSDWEFMKDGEQETKYDSWAAARGRLRGLQKEGQTEYFVAKDKTYGKYYIAKEVQRHPVVMPEEAKVAQREGIDLEEEMARAAYAEEIKVVDGVPVRQPPESVLSEPKKISEVTPDEWASKFREPRAFQGERDKVKAQLESKYDPDVADKAMFIMDARAKVAGIEPEEFYSRRHWQAFDVTVGDRFKQEVTGRTQYKDGKAITDLYAGADKHTLIHEMWHQFELDLEPQLRAKMDVLRARPEEQAFLREKGFAPGEAMRDTMAYRFEDWLATGEFPFKEPEVKTAFEQFKQWLKEIFMGLKARDMTLSPEMEAFFRETFGISEAQVSKAKLSAIQAKQQAKLDAAKKAAEDKKAEKLKAYAARLPEVEALAKEVPPGQTLSVSQIQRRLKLTFAQASDLAELYKAKAVVTPAKAKKAPKAKAAPEPEAVAPRAPEEVKAELDAEEGMLKNINTPVEEKISVADAERAVNQLNMLERNAKRGDQAQRQAAQEELSDFQRKLQERGLDREYLERRAKEKVEEAEPEAGEPMGTQKDIDYLGEGKVEESPAVDFEPRQETMEVRAIEDYKPIPETFQDELFELVRKDNKTATLRFPRGEQFVEEVIPIADYNRYFREEGLFQRAERINKQGLEDSEWKDYIKSIEQAIMRKEPVSLETLRQTKDYSDLIDQTFEDIKAFNSKKWEADFKKLGKPEREAAEVMEKFANDAHAQEQYRIAKAASTKSKDITPEDAAQVETLLQRVETYTPMLDRLSTAAEHPDFGKVVNLGGELKPLTGLEERATPGEMIADLKLASDAFVKMLKDEPQRLLENPAKSAKLFDKFNQIYEAVAKFDERIESAQMSWIYDPKMASRRWLKGAWAVAADDLFSKNNPAMFHLMTKINGMHWMAKKFPVLQPMYELQWKRLEDATILAGDIMKGSDAKVEFKGKTYTLDGFWPLVSLKQKDEAAYDWVAKLLWLGDAEQKRYKREDLVKLTERAFGRRREDVIAAYEAVRNTQDYIFYNTVKYLTAGVEDPKKVQELEADLFKRMNYHTGYLPHAREGKWVLAVFENQKKTDTLYMRKVRNYLDAQNQLKELQSQYPNNQVKLMSAREAARVGVTAKQEVMGLIEDLAKNAHTDVQTTDALREAAMQMLKEKGYWTHFKERKDVPGYDTRLSRVLYNQAQEYAGFMSKMEFAKAGWQELAKLRKGGLNELHNYGRDWFDLMLKQSDATDQFMGRIRSALFLKYLGMNLKSSLVTTVEKITNVPQYLGFYTDKPHQYNLKATKDLASWVKWTMEAQKHIKENQMTDYKYNWRNALEDLKLPDNIKQDEAEMLRNLFHKGATRAQFMQEVSAQSEARWDIPSDRKSFEKAQDFIDKMGNQTMKYGSWLIGKMEQYGRESTALAAYRIFRDKGYDALKAERMAERLVFDSHFMYGRANQPLWMNKGGVNRLAKLALTFRTQEWNYLNMLGTLIGMPGNKGKIAAAKSLLTLAALGGGTALPFFAGANKILAMTTGVEPAEAIRKKLDEMTDSEYMGNLFGEGLPSMLGLTLTGSLRVGGDFTLREMIGGAFGSAMADMSSAASAAKEGDWMTFAEKFLPMVAANPVKAYERYKYGVMTGRGNPVTMAPGEEILKLHGEEALAHMLGFQPQRVTRAQEKQGARIRSEEYYRGQRTKIYGSLKKGLLRGDQKAIDRAFERVMEFNLSLPAHVAPITSQSIKQSLSQRPRLRQMLQEQELFGSTP